MKNFIRKIRLKLAKALWPKDVRQGELFTIVCHLREGKPTSDGSWVGSTLRADRVDGDRIKFSELNEYVLPIRKFEPVGHLLVPGTNCVVKPVKIPLAREEKVRRYHEVKSRMIVLEK